jgi:predicted Zn-dependent protease
VGAIGGAVGIFYMANLETVPLSNRRRFNVISPQLEAQLGEQQFRQILQEYRGQILSDWDPRVRMVHRVMNRLIPVSGLENEKWEVHVIEDDQINAFVLPG